MKLDLVHGLEGALNRYRVLAIMVGVGLLILTAIGMPLQYLANSKIVVEIVGPIHGFLYIVYLATGFDLARRGRWTLFQLAQVILAGLVPLLAFYVEHKVTQRYKDVESK